MAGATTFEGTPAETVSWLQTYHSMQRAFLEGAEIGNPRREELLGQLDRAVFRVTVEPLGMVAAQRVRPEHRARVERLETGLMLFDSLAPRAKE